MEQYKLNVGNVPEKANKRWYNIDLKDELLHKKLASPLGYIFLTVCCLSLGILISSGGTKIALIIMAIIIGLPAIYFIVAYPKVGITVLLVSAYLVMWFLRMGISFPLGTVLDGIQALLIIGFLIKQKYHPNWKIFKNPVSYMILIWIGYNILQLFNPVAESRLVWVYSIRSVAVVMLMYFVFVYYIKTIEFIRFILKLWIAFSLFAALYGLWQEYIGFFPFEQAYLNSDPKIKNLLFIAGHWRRFSIFSDPVAFSYNMVVSSILCIVLLFGPIKFYKKIILGIITMILLLSMIYSGTRGAYVLLPAALIILVILKLNKQILIFSVFAGLAFAFLIFVPTTNSHIYRFQTAFRPSEDASFNVRSINQKRIQPYIRSHPFGAGLGAVSATGKKLVRHSVLTGFAPDSGYVRVAVELGWIGLFLFCTLLFVVIRNGIDNYYRIKNPELKNYCLAMTLIAFAFHVGSYPQEAIVQFPSSIYFYLVIALITVTYQIDKRDNEKKQITSGEYI